MQYAKVIKEKQSLNDMQMYSSYTARFFFQSRSNVHALIAESRRARWCHNQGEQCGFAVGRLTDTLACEFHHLCNAAPLGPSVSQSPFGRV